MSRLAVFLSTLATLLLHSNGQIGQLFLTLSDKSIFYIER